MQVSMSQECALQQPEDSPLWSENFALVLADEQSGTTALYSIGTWYHDPTIWRENLAVALGDGQILVTRNFGRNTAGARVSASLSRYEILAPGRTVSLSYDGPVSSHSFEQLMAPGALNCRTSRLELTLEFEAEAPMWDMHAARHADPTGIAGAMHIEQLGRVSGSVRLDGSKISIRSAASCRDHSRGKRDVTNYRNHCWINGRFPSGCGFQLYFFRMHGMEQPALSLATIIEHGEHHAATIEHVEVIDSAADVRKPHYIVLRSALQEMRIEVDEPIGTIPLHMTAPFNPAFGVGQGSHGLLFDQGVRLRSGGEKGIGWCERGFAREPIR